MEPLTLAALAGLALIDSTSIGTLVLPVVMLVAPRVDPRRYAVYLLTVGGFYAVVGIALVLGANAAASVMREAGDLTWLRWVQLLVGLALFVFGVVGDKILDWLRPEAEDGPRRSETWGARLIGADASYATVVTVGLAAALVEVASMLPFLAAVGIITAADLSASTSAGVVLGYSAVMMLPAVLLLGLRLALAGRIEGPLTRFSATLSKLTEGAIYWVCAIVGFFVAGDAVGALQSAGALG